MVKRPDSHCRGHRFDPQSGNYLVNAMVFPVVMYGCESWTIKRAERTYMRTTVYRGCRDPAGTDYRCKAPRAYFESSENIIATTVPATMPTCHASLFPTLSGLGSHQNLPEQGSARSTPLTPV